MRNPVSGLYEVLVSGGGIGDRFAGEVAVDSPMRGSQPASDWVCDESAWLVDHQAKVHAINHIVTDSHASAEYNLAISNEGVAIDLPVHLVAELDGDMISALRVYHSTSTIWQIGPTGRWIACIQWCSSTPSSSRSATAKSPTGPCIQRSGSPSMASEKQRLEGVRSVLGLLTGDTAGHLEHERHRIVERTVPAGDPGQGAFP